MTRLQLIAISLVAIAVGVSIFLYDRNSNIHAALGIAITIFGASGLLVGLFGKEIS
jgi:hypothetical protein